jgi:hypothetical protein
VPVLDVDVGVGVGIGIGISNGKEKIEGDLAHPDPGCSGQTEDGR